MSTQITAVYDAMVARIVAKLGASYNQLANPYRPEENPEILLKKGYGVAIGAGVNTRRQISQCRYSINRNFTVVLSQVVDALEGDGAAKAINEKLLFEDQLLIIKDFEVEYTLNGTAKKTQFTSDGGLKYAQGKNESYIIVETLFEVEYFETFT